MTGITYRLRSFTPSSEVALSEQHLDRPLDSKKRTNRRRCRVCLAESGRDGLRPAGRQTRAGLYSCKFLQVGAARILRRDIRPWMRPERLSTFGSRFRKQRA